MAVAVALYAINFATFPEPPSIDLGPLLELWYAIVSGLLLRRAALALNSRAS